MTAAKPFHVLYLAAQLPAQSETFVYREVLGLRRRGRMKVSVASIRAPVRNLGEDSVDALADEALAVYPPGKLRLLADAAPGLLSLGGWKALICGIKDVLLERDVPLTKRPKVLWQCLAGLALAWRVRGDGIDHLHAHMAHVPTTIAMYAAIALGVPFSFTGHAADLFRDRCLLLAKLRRAQRVMCISHWHRRFYQNLAQKPADRFPVVRCGVETESWHSNASEIAASPRILTVGRLVPKKGIDVLIRAVARLREHKVDAKCTIVGEGPQREAIETLIHELRLEKYVCLAGARPNEEVRQLMQEHAVFALPCRIDAANDRDGIPVVLMEAMACGVAVVSGDLPTIRELIEHDVNGLLVPPDNVVALAAALERLLSDPPKRRSLGVAARRTVEEEFSLRLNLDRLEAALTARPAPAGELTAATEVPDRQLVHAAAVD